MATYRLVPESEWKAAVEAVEALAKALKQAGTVTIPGIAEPTAKTGTPTKGESLAKQVIQRVDAGGAKHEPKIFDRAGPKIADFVYVLTNGSFTVPEVIDKVGRYVALKETRREAGGQIRTAVRADTARFEPGPSGRYFKKNEPASE